MSLTLALNTASQENAIALIESGRVLNERAWISQADESEKVLAYLVEVMDQEGKAWKDIERVVGVVGPGSYTSLRVGLTLANTIAWTLERPIAGVNVFDIWEHRIEKAFRAEPHTIVVASGKGHILTSERRERIPLEALKGGAPYYGELPEGYDGFQPVAHSFGTAVAELEARGILTFGLPPVEPFYIAPPHITVSKK